MGLAALTPNQKRSNQAPALVGWQEQIAPCPRISIDQHLLGISAAPPDIQRNFERDR